MTITLLLALLILLGFCAQWLAWRVKVPAILFLLLLGLTLGPGLGVLDPSAVFGDLLFPVVSLAVAVILFEGALSLNFAEVRTLSTTVQLLISVGALVTWAVVGVASYLLLDLRPGIAVLFGAIMVVTGPTVVAPMLRTVRPTANIRRVLRWEGIVIDPIGALLAVVVFEFITSSEQGHAFQHSLVIFCKVVLIGALLGAASGWLLGQALRRYLIPEYLQTMAVLAAVVVTFALSNSLAHESGLLAVTVMGMWLANTPKLKLDEILHFKEHLTLLLISGLFVILAARVELAGLLEIGWQAVALLAVMQLLARPLAVGLSTLGSNLNWRERVMVAWIAPRGIVAAAVSALFALELQEQGYPGGELLVPLTFAAIIGTVLLQSLTAKPLAKLLQVAESAPIGFLIFGANPVARKLGNCLQELGFNVLLCDSNWHYVKSAKLEGLNTFYGSPISEYADAKLDTVGLGRLLALSPYRELNAIATMRYRSEFGHNNVFSLADQSDVTSSEKHRLSADHQGHLLFNRYLTYSMLEVLVREGAEIKRTKLSEEFDFKAYRKRNAEAILPLFALSPKGKLEVFVGDEDLEPGPGWTVIGLAYGAAATSG